MDDPKTNWTQIALALIGFGTLLVNVNCNHSETKSAQQQNAARIEATAAKVDAVAVKAEEAKAAVDVHAEKQERKMDAVAEKTDKIMGKIK